MNIVSGAQDQWFRLLADTAPVGLVICDLDQGLVRYANAHAAALLQQALDDMPGTCLLEILRSRCVQSDPDDCLLRGAEPYSGEIQLWQGERARPLWVGLHSSRFQAGAIALQSVLLIDVSKTRELADQLNYQASHDSLTGLMNRREFEQRLCEVIATAATRGGNQVLCYLDLDQFKEVNDSCGHGAGDALLRQLAAELRNCMRPDATLARLGGDEFAILLENCSLEQARYSANQVLRMIRNFRFTWQGSVFTIGISIGLAAIRPTGESLTEALRRADAACYAAKEAGRNRLHVFRCDDRAWPRAMPASARANCHE